MDYSAVRHSNSSFVDVGLRVYGELAVDEPTRSPVLVVKARVPHLKYSDGNVEELAVPWAERYSRVSTPMGAFVLKLLEACPNTKKVCELTGLACHALILDCIAP